MTKFFSILLIFFTTSAIAQNNVQQALQLITEAQKANADSVRIALANQAADIFEQVLASGEDITNQVDNKIVSALTNQVANFSIYTWGIQYSDGHYSYYGFAQTTSEYGGTIVTRLTDIPNHHQNMQDSELQSNNWFGAIYYELVPLEGKKSKKYALVGWDGGDLFVNRKVIEQVRIKSDGSLYFGGYFTSENHKKHKRLIFEFTEQAVMSIRYNQKLKLFVADHLSTPPNSPYKGNSRFMGPDGSFDGYKFVKGEWLFVSDLDIKASRF